MSAKKSRRGYAPCLYKVYARARKASGGRGGVVAAADTTHDTFISIRARNAQYSMDLPYVKSRQIAENLLVLPNWKLVANRRSRKVSAIPIYLVGGKVKGASYRVLIRFSRRPFQVAPLLAIKLISKNLRIRLDKTYPKVCNSNEWHKVKDTFFRAHLQDKSHRRSNESEHIRKETNCDCTRKVRFSWKYALFCAFTA